MRTTATLLFAGFFGLAALGASAEEAKIKTVGALYKEQTALVGQEVSLQGKVTKVNNGIMGRNFLHIQDGSGEQGSNDLTITSKQTASVGDQVMVTGRVFLNRDFGSGYLYPLLLEDSKITAKK
jgi:hypothetical protein